MKWKLKRSVWGWSLFYEGELVSSANNPMELVAATMSNAYFTNAALN